MPPRRAAPTFTQTTSSLHFPSGEEIWLAAFKLEFENDEVGVEKVWESGVNDKAFAKVMFSCPPTPFHTTGPSSSAHSQQG